MIEVLEAFPAHGQVLADLHAQSVDDPWSAGFFTDILAKPSVLALIAAENSGKRPLGFVLAQKAADEAEILMVATLPAARRQGVGWKLMVSIAERLKEGGVTALHLEVAENNAPAWALYEGLGFKEVGRRADYYRQAGGLVDALLLRLNLVERDLRTK